MIWKFCADTRNQDPWVGWDTPAWKWRRSERHTTAGQMGVRGGPVCAWLVLSSLVVACGSELARDGGVAAGFDGEGGHRRLRAGSGGKKRDANQGEEVEVVVYQYWEDFGNPPYVPGDDSGDRLCTIVFGVVCGTALLSVLVILSDPWWPPFEERSPGLMIMMCLSSVVWSWASLVIDNHAPEWMILASLTPGDGTATVKFWLVWMRMVAGSGLFIGCLFVRLHTANALYVVNDVKEPIWWAFRLLKYMTPWLVLVCLRLFFLATQMEAVSMWTISLAIGAGHACFLIWLVASIDRKPERRRGIGDINITMWWVLLMTGTLPCQATCSSPTETRCVWLVSSWSFVLARCCHRL